MPTAGARRSAERFRRLLWAGGRDVIPGPIERRHRGSEAHSVALRGVFLGRADRAGRLLGGEDREHFRVALVAGGRVVQGREGRPAVSRVPGAVRSSPNAGRISLMGM